MTAVLQACRSVHRLDDFASTACPASRLFCLQNHATWLKSLHLPMPLSSEKASLQWSYWAADMSDTCASIHSSQRFHVPNCVRSSQLALLVSFPTSTLLHCHRDQVAGREAFLGRPSSVTFSLPQAQLLISHGRMPFLSKLVSHLPHLPSTPALYNTHFLSPLNFLSRVLPSVFDHRHSISVLCSSTPLFILFASVTACPAIPTSRTPFLLLFSQSPLSASLQPKAQAVFSGSAVVKTPGSSVVASPATSLDHVAWRGIEAYMRGLPPGHGQVLPPSFIHYPSTQASCGETHQSIMVCHGS
jgi:hypothetical protein